jgi:hypothetical protein
MKNYSLLLFFGFLLLSNTNQAQVDQNVLVEHFTNTRCGTCASRNPGLRTNLSNNPEILHLTFHPSSPYSSCVLSQHNKSGNDDRTNYYGIYGGTPRIVIQGNVVSASTNYASSSIFNPYINKTSPFSIKVTTTKNDADSLVGNVVIKTIANHSYTSLNLFVPAVEDTVFYNAPNGEKEHLNVFRKAIIEQKLTSIPSVGDSVVFAIENEMDNTWAPNHMYILALLQDSATKEIVQVTRSEEADTSSGGSANVEDILNTKGISVYPNPFTGELKINLHHDNAAQLSIMNSLGQQVHQQTITNKESIELNDLENGIYWLQFKLQNRVITKKVFKVQ